MTQLNLFEHAPRHYYEALRRLGRLDFEGCRASLEQHCQQFPKGLDLRPVQDAAAWLASHVPQENADAREFARRALEACRTLREGRNPLPLLRPAAEIARSAVQTLSTRSLAKMEAAGATVSDNLVDGLPWAVFLLWAGRPTRASEALIRSLRSREPSTLAYLALGDCLWMNRRWEQALRVYREGYGLNPFGAGWAPDCELIPELRQRFASDPVFAENWWVVGAYLEDGLPPYDLADPALVTKRWRRFLRQRERLPREPDARPRVFFAGLFLSEHASMLPSNDLATVRRTLRDLHPEAFEMHMERLVERGPPTRVEGREYIGW